MLWKTSQNSWRHLWENWFPKNCGIGSAVADTDKCVLKQKKKTFASTPQSSGVMCQQLKCFVIGHFVAPLDLEMHQQTNQLFLGLIFHQMPHKSVRKVFFFLVFFWNILLTHKHTKGSIFLTEHDWKPKYKHLFSPCFCLFVLHGGSVSVYLSLLLSCALRVPREKGKCVTKICSSMRFLFEARNTSHDFLKPNYNPVSAVTRGFSTSWGGGLRGKIGRVISDSQHTLSQARARLLDSNLGLPLDCWTGSEGSHSDFKGALFLGMRSMQIWVWSCGLKCLTAVIRTQAACLSRLSGKRKISHMNVWWLFTQSDRVFEVFRCILVTYIFVCELSGEQIKTPACKKKKHIGRCHQFLTKAQNAEYVSLSLPRLWVLSCTLLCVSFWGGNIFATLRLRSD